MDFPQSDDQAMVAPQKPTAHMPPPDLATTLAGKENLTTDLSTMSAVKAKNRITKKSRSKSIGPGGLDALKEDPGNRRKSAIIPVVKSILKPTIPLSPLRAIPPHASVRGRSPKKSRSSPSKIPIPVVPHEVVGHGTASVTGVERLSNPFEESSTGAHSNGNTTVALRTEEEQQLAAKEREENARRESEKNEILERRDARRKSLANRRVSFAPEATLHTWDVVELPEDSTTSSASTNATRRASSTSAASAASPYPLSPLPNSDLSEAPSTPPEQAEQSATTASPAHQRDLHQRKRRRRSEAIPPMNFNNPDDEFLSSSPVSGSSVAGSDDTTVQVDDTADGDDSSVFEDDAVAVEEGESTVMDLDVDDPTSQSVNSARSIGSSGASTGSSGKLEEALRQAAKQAGTQGIEYDEHGDLTMDMADDEVTAAFQPWVKQGIYLPQVIANLSSLQGQENINPFSPAFKASITPKQSPRQNSHSLDDEETSMDITRAVGGILAAQVPSSDSQQHPVGHRGRRSSVSRRRSSGQGSSLGDETMDFTVAVGGIKASDQSEDQLEEASNVDRDEELTMEFTVGLGGLLSENQKSGQSRRNSARDDQLATQQLLNGERRRESGSSIIGGDQMDMTEVVGGILPEIEETSETPRVEQEHETVAMDITTAIGAILPKQLSAGNRSQAKALMERETDAGQLSPFQVERALALPPRSTLSTHLTTVASETGSPSLTTARTRASTRKSVGSAQSTPRRVSRQTTPTKKPATPSKQVTPVAPRPTTPGKTPPNKNVTFRAASPKKLFKAEIKSAHSTPHSSKPKDLFQHNAKTGMTTPSILLTPKPRILSGLGIDKPGLGSPRVAAILNRRGSIGEQAETFTPLNQAGKGVRFDDPRIMEQEVEMEREEQQRRESGRVILEQEVDGHGNLEEKDVTVNLKEMIESLTPKKKKLHGRKSLHVGAAKGILGKRPAELDEDDDDENGTPKVLKGREGSPVKNVKLPGPPPKVETTGKVSRAVRKSLDQITANIGTTTPSTAVSPAEQRNVTPKNQGRFKDVEPAQAEIPIPFAEKLTAEVQEAVEPVEEEQRIHLQDFLNLTSIRFMELTTTKRRHTVAPNLLLEDKASNASSTVEDGKSGRDLESCVVAAACTVPMLDLFQHSCRELKKYISEGRSIVREIETDTFEDNPPLFREYISAAPEVKVIMDNQFKNVKTHARLSSKAMWYEWRMKLLDELKKGLNAISKGMEQDESTLLQQEELLQSVLPELLAKHEALQQESQKLQTHAQELANCDQNELNDARQKLRATEGDIESKRAMIEEMTRKLKEKEDGIEAVVESKEECVSHIKEAERVREECRGWSVSEVSLLKAKVDALEKTHGWTITAASGTTLTMTYRQILQLSFDVATFLPDNLHPPPSPTVQTKPESSSPITLTYIADTHPFHPVPLTTEHQFFLNLIRARLQSLPQARTKLNDILTSIKTTWMLADTVAEEVRILNLGHITSCTILSDTVLAVTASLLLPALERKTKVEVRFLVDVSPGSSLPPSDGEEVVGGGERGLESVKAKVTSTAKVVYGEKFNEEKMGDFLRGRVAHVATGGVGKDEGRGTWGVAVGELGVRLGVARGRG